MRLSVYFRTDCYIFGFLIESSLCEIDCIPGPCPVWLSLSNLWMLVGQSKQDGDQNVNLAKFAVDDEEDLKYSEDLI